MKGEEEMKNMQNIQMVFPGGKRKAFTVSYDDGAAADIRLAELMRKYGIKGTFNLCTDFLGVKTDVFPGGGFVSEDEIKDVYNGQEIACHTLSHMKLTDIGATAVSYQLAANRCSLEKLSGQIVTGAAYPFGFYDKKVLDILKNCGFEYARTTISTGKYDLPENFLAWHPTCHHNDERLFSLLETFFIDSEFPGFPQVFSLWGHSFEFDRIDNWDRIERVFSLVSGQEDKVWLAVNGEIVSYVNSFRQLRYSADCSMIYNPSCREIWISVDDTVYNIPGGKAVKPETKF